MRLLRSILVVGALLAPLAGLMFEYAEAQGRGVQRFAVVGRYVTGLADGTGDVTAAETVAYGAGRMYVTNSSDNSLDIVAISDQAQLEAPTRISLAAYGAGPNSVAYADGVVAVAVESSPKTAPGSVVFFDAAGTYLNQVQVGALPDMLTFTPNGRVLLVANEGEPNNDYTVDPAGTVSVIRIGDLGPAALTDADVVTLGFDTFDTAALQRQGVRIFGPGASAAQDLEPEYIAVSHNSQTAYVTLQENNALALVDLKHPRITAVLPLGVKDHRLTGSGIDASDRDSAINIASWPVYGMYQPDAIASYQVRGRTYLVTANEGDARDYNPGLREEAAVRDLTLDPAAFPDAPVLRNNAALGRLTVTKANGDIDGDGDYDALYAFGGRSFAIWDEQGKLVYDSGDAIEREVARSYPSFFNTNNTANTFDNRSDNKGPEPEGVAVGNIGGHTYAFVGLERQGGIIIFDVSNPAAPSLVQYVNSRDFTASPAQTDSGPEVVRFVKDGPGGRPLILLANEVSGSIVLIQPE